MAGMIEVDMLNMHLIFKNVKLISGNTKEFLNNCTSYMVNLPI